MSTSRTVNYRDLAHASYHNAIHDKIQESMNIIDNVNCLLKDVNETYEAFCDKLTLIFNKFSKSSLSSTYSPEFLELWNFLLQYFSTEAQIYHEFCDDFDILLCNPLRSIAIHKSAQREKLYDFRCAVEKTLGDQSEKIEQLHREYIDQYQLQREKYDQKRIPGLLNSHNNYVLQLVASNKMKDQYHSQALPSILDELETIQRDLIQIFHNSLAQYAAAANKKHRKLIDFQEHFLGNIKSLSVDDQIINFVKQLNTNQVVSYWRREQFLPPDGDCPEILARDDVISDKLTLRPIQQIRTTLMKEKNELLSFISQNEEVINTLKSMKTDGVSYCRSSEKIYELEDDISRKQNEVRMAQVQVAGVIAQLQHIESKKLSGFLLKDGEDTAMKKIWKKAVFSLKRDKGTKNLSLIKNIKKGSIRPASSPFYSTFQYDDSKIDPVYHILRYGTSRSQLSNAQNDFIDANSSPTPKYNEMAYQNSTGRLSLIQTPFSAATLSRRRLLLYQSKIKSSSVDGGGSHNANEKDHGINFHWTDTLHSDQKDDYLQKSTKPIKNKKSSNSTNKQIDKKGKLETGSTSTSKISASSSESRHCKLNEQTKSISLDNPCKMNFADCFSGSYHDRGKDIIDWRSKKKISELNATTSPRRRRDIFGRHKSSSLEDDGHLINRRVSFVDEVMNKKSELLSPRKYSLSTNEKTHNSKELMFKFQMMSSQTKHAFNLCQVKSFSLENLDTENDSDFKAIHDNHLDEFMTDKQENEEQNPLENCQLHETKRLDKIFESQEKSLSFDVSNQQQAADMIASTDQKITKGNNEEKGVKLQLEKLRYRLKGNLYVALYDFWPRRKDELNLRAGWKVSGIDISHSDWWTGKCNGKFGYFPNSHVQGIHQGEYVWRVLREMSTTDSAHNPVKVYKNQIVIQTGSLKNDQVLIRTKSNTTFWCPIDYLTKVIDN